MFRAPGVAARRRDLKVVVTSATLNAERFSEFFGGVPIFASLAAHSRWTLTAKVPPSTAWRRQETGARIHFSHPPGDILVFMTGQGDVEAVCGLMAERVAAVEDGGWPHCCCCVQSAARRLQARIFEAAERGTRKCNDTNIAETR